MRILLTNDDGVLSPVLRRSAEALSTAHEVIVAAPAKDQSGKSHAFTHGMGALLACDRDDSEPWPFYRVDGTPSDCVKFAVSHLLKNNPPDLVISGPNLGENAGISVIYSGTVAAAREGALWRIPALAVSLPDGSGAHLEFALKWLLNLIEEGLLPAPGTLWNINFPACAPEAVAGARFAPMSTVMFRDHYVEAETAHKVPGWQLLGHKPAEEFDPAADDALLAARHVTVAPLRLSQTDEDALRALKGREDRLVALTGEAARAAR